PPPPKPLDPRIKKILVPAIAVIALIVLYIAWSFGEVYLSRMFVKSYPPTLLYGIEESNDIQYVDLNTMKINTVTMSSGFKDVTYSDKSKFFYGLDFSGETLIEFDVHTRKMLRSVKIGKEASSITLSLNNDTAYVTNYRSDNLSIIDLTKFKEVLPAVLVGSGPVKSVLSSDGRTLCILNERQNTVAFLNTRDNILTGSATLGQDGKDLAMSQDNTKIYVVHSFSDKLSTINISTKNVIKTLSVPSGPVGIVSLRKVNKLYIITENSKELLFVDPEEGIKDRVSLDFIPIHMALSSDTDEKIIFITGRSLSGYVVALYDRLNKQCKIISQPARAPVFILPIYIW
ncbi:MAG: hypothetical protein ABRQ39_28075, partial [Candidatus Eremiobacterota bacterium]